MTISFPPSSKRISIHSLRMEGDGFASGASYGDMVFQSTPSVWRETNDYFFFCVRIDISIHSLRMEGDRRTDQNGPP